MKNILVIKLGALGDFIQATGPMAAIRKHHQSAKITLLTTKPFSKMGEECGYFDEIMIDNRPNWYQISGWLDLRGRLINEQFERVYDLQNNDRTSFYFKLFPAARKPEWVGVAKGASHRNTSPQRTAGHAFEGHAQTLGLAGIKNIKIDPLKWMKAETKDLGLKKPYVIIAPGSAPDRPEKRWPAESYASLACYLIKKGHQPVILGTQAEKRVTDTIENLCPDVLNLNGKTSLYHIAALGRGASMAIGNDTGPMHLAAATGCPCLVLFSQYSDPVRHAPKGDQVSVLREKELEDLSVDKVVQTIDQKIKAAA